MSRNSFLSAILPTFVQIPMLYFSKLLQHARHGEVATQDFLGILCVAKLFPEQRALRGRGERGKERVEPRGVARPDPASSQLTDGVLFWGGPKKSPPYFAPSLHPLSGNLAPSDSVLLPQRALGEGLRKARRHAFFTFLPAPPLSSSDFFGHHPKKAPLF
jgi:hypothetical protein